MAPHLEAYGSEVMNTMHKTEDTESYNAKKAHALLREHPERYDEVADEKGAVCEKVKTCGVVTIYNAFRNEKRDATVEAA